MLSIMISHMCFQDSSHNKVRPLDNCGCEEMLVGTLLAGLLSSFKLDPNVFSLRFSLSCAGRACQILHEN